MLTRLLLLGLLAGSLALAQPGGSGGGGDMGGGGGGGGRGGDMGAMPMQQTPTTLDRLTQIFRFDRDQRKSVKTILDDAQKEAIPVRDQLVKGRLDIAQAIQAGKGQDEIQKAVAGYAALQSQMTEIEIKAFAQIFKLMQADQRKNATQLFAMTSGLFKGKNWNESR